MHSVILSEICTEFMYKVESEIMAVVWPQGDEHLAGWPI